MNPPRVNILGTGVHAVDMDTAVRRMIGAVADRPEEGGYVCVTGVHGVMDAWRHRDFQRIQNASFLTVPDGMPLVWVGRLRGYRRMGRVYGPDLMLQVCEEGVSRDATHFLYGGKPGVAEELKSNLEARFPGIRVVGTYGPPFRPLNASEEDDLIRMVRETKPNFFWVGLSTPKQERFMAAYRGRLDAGLMIGVGAAFDLHTGRMTDAPGWIKSAGLQWLHRLCQEPKRLWKRYLINNPLFLLLIFLQAVRVLRVPEPGNGEAPRRPS